jgi:hypothetical protein
MDPAEYLNYLIAENTNYLKERVTKCGERGIDPDTDYTIIYVRSKLASYKIMLQDFIDGHPIVEVL